MLIHFPTLQIYLCLHLFILMSNAADSNNTATWTTREELLLAFAVKRHGLKDWEAVAMELQNRHRSASVFTPEICKEKYRNLRRRFRNQKSNSYHRAAAANGGCGGGGSDSDGDENNDGVVGGGYIESFAWLEELRKLRVAELKQEVQRYDLSIETLQIKVKTLEEERENSLNENSRDGLNIPDLDGAIKLDRLETDIKAGDNRLPDGAAVKTASSCDENRSVNESNSTENRQTEPKQETEPDDKVKKGQEQIKPVKDEEDSCDDSLDRHKMVGAMRPGTEKDGVDSAAELHDSVCESKEESQGAKETSDVESSASLMIKKCRNGEAEDGGGETAAVLSPSATGMKGEYRDAVESEPLVAVLDTILSHTHGSMFERRLESQKTERYKKMIKQHMDLETVQTRIQDGSYSASPSRFYVDLLLLVNNANVFFPKSSPESIAACELRSLVMKELKNNHPLTPRQASSTRLQTKTEPEKSGSLLAKHKSTAPLIVCKKRSSISGKAATTFNKPEKQEEDKAHSAPKPTVKSTPTTSNEDDTSLKFKVQENPVTGVRSMRRGSSSKGRPSVSSSQSGPSGIQRPISTSQPLDSTEKPEASRGDKRKSEVTSTVKKKGAADFLKRMKKNEPAEVTHLESIKNAGDSGTKGKKNSKDHHPTRKPDEKKDVRRSGGSGGCNKNMKEEISLSKRIGRPPKKKGKETVVTGKRGRDGGEGEGSSKQPKKKSRK